MSLLKSRGWANELSAGDAIHNYGYAMFSVDIVLTEEGFEHVDEVVGVVFAYISMLQEAGPQPQFYEELRLLDEMAFRFKAKSAPIRFVCFCYYKHEKENNFLPSIS